MTALCAMPLSNIVRPIIGFIGPEGSAKTTAARIFKSVFNPCSPLETNFKRNDEDLSLNLFHNAMPLFDNLSGIPQWISDMFCKAITGDGYFRRKRWTDSDQAVISYRRPILFTAMDIPSRQSDFLDRCVIIELNRISKENWKSETKIMENFEKDLPLILGGCLDTIVNAKKILPTLHLRQTPRLSDFARWGAAIAKALGYDPDDYMNALIERMEQKKADIIISSEPVAIAIMKYMENHGQYEGLSSKFFEAVKQYCPLGDGETAGWPKAANGFGKMLKKLEGTLCDKGIIIKSWHDRGGTMLKIHLAETPSVNDDSVAEAEIPSKSEAAPSENAAESENPAAEKTFPYQDKNEEVVSCGDCRLLDEIKNNMYLCKVTGKTFSGDEILEERLCDQFKKNSEDELEDELENELEDELEGYKSVFD
jgi:hypothetical protein